MIMKDKFEKEFKAGDFVFWPKASGTSSAEMRVIKVVTVLPKSLRVVLLNGRDEPEYTFARAVSECVIVPESIIPEKILKLLEGF